jgi:hypothetical protein
VSVRVRACACVCVRVRACACSAANVFFHLHGTKDVILVPPDVMADAAHLFPAFHPAYRQSQLAWDAEHSSRRPDGFSTVVGSDAERPPPAYLGAHERRVSLRPGEVLFIPSHWGHQTFSSLDGPSVSLALWFYPHTNPRGVRPSPNQLRNQGTEAARTKAANDALSQVQSVQQAWAALRALGRQVAIELLGATEGAALLGRWATQRWRPQLGGLGVRAELPLHAHIVCQPEASAEDVASAARPLAMHLRSVCDWSPAAYRDAVLRVELQDALDWLVGRMPRLNGLQAALDDEGEPRTLAQMLWLGVRSFSECS